MKRDVSVVFSASYVAHVIRLLIYVLYNLKAWGDSVCRFIMFQVTENKGGKWHTMARRVCLVRASLAFFAKRKARTVHQFAVLIELNILADGLSGELLR